MTGGAGCDTVIANPSQMAIAPGPFCVMDRFTGRLLGRYDAAWHAQHEADKLNDAGVPGYVRFVVREPRAGG